MALNGLCRYTLVNDIALSSHQHELIKNSISIILIVFSGTTFADAVMFFDTQRIELPLSLGLILQ